MTCLDASIQKVVFLDIFLDSSWRVIAECPKFSMSQVFVCPKLSELSYLCIIVNLFLEMNLMEIKNTKEQWIHLEKSTIETFNSVKSKPKKSKQFKNFFFQKTNFSHSVRIKIQASNSVEVSLWFDLWFTPLLNLWLINFRFAFRSELPNVIYL